MHALSIRQPYAELILRGVKMVEYRSRPTRMIGRRFYIYVARQWAGITAGVGDDMGDLEPDDLPTGVIVGSAVISRCVPNGTPGTPGSPGSPGVFEWHLTDVRRYRRHRRPKRQPQPVWFRPF